jgi:hypothetical protein
VLTQSWNSCPQRRRILVNGEKGKLTYGTQQDKCNARDLSGRICSTSHGKGIPDDRVLLGCHTQVSVTQPTTYSQSINHKVMLM